MQTITQTFRSVWRQLCHSPEVTILAVVTLALGIGANTAMFTVVESVLLRPLPYSDPGRLMHIVTTGGETSGAVSWLDYLDIRNQSRTLATVGGYSNDAAVVQHNDSSVSVLASQVTPNVFIILGTQPLQGRTFSEEEAQINGPRAVVLSESLSRHIFGSSVAAIGKTLRVNGNDRTIVGVMPANFRFPESAGKEVEKGLWLPMQPTPEMLHDRGFDFFMILAKSAPAMATPQVQAELALIARRIRATDLHADPKLAFHAESYTETITGPVRSVFWALVAALGLVLLIVCANVANLLIARGLARRHEFAVRAALGAGPGRLVALMIAEAGTLSLLGSALGLLISYGIVSAIHSLPTGTIPRAETIEIRWTVLLVLAAIATFTTTLSALVPALSVVKTNAQAALRSGSRSVGARGSSANITGWLVAGEVALSAALLVATGLLFRTLWGLEHTKLGFDVAGVSSFTAMPPDASANPDVSRAASVYSPLLESLRHTPGFEDAALVTAPPFSGFALETSFRVYGWPRKSQQGLSARLTAVSGRYHELMRTSVIRGRTITDQDAANTPFVAVINETLARRFFSAKDAIGQQLDLGGRATGMVKPYTIIGIVADQIDTATSQPPHPLLMLSYQQIPPASLFYPSLLQSAVHFVVKTRADFPVASTVHSVFRRAGSDLALDNFQTMQALVDQSNSNSRLGLYLIEVFAALAILMVVVGLYGVLTQVVRQRCREFGLRMALGATRQNIARMILWRGSAIVSVGLIFGAAVAISLGRLIDAFLFGVKPLDPGVYAFAIAALFLIGVCAALIPAWRAASLEPVKALRDE